MARSVSKGAQGGKDSPLWTWLESQIAWYDRKALANQRAYKASKVAIILFALAIPVLAEYGVLPGVHDARALLVSIAAGVILLLEGLQHLNKWQENWILYRSTCEALRHERQMFLMGSGPYTKLRKPRAEQVLAERVSDLVSAERSKWAVAHRHKAETTTGG